MVVYKDCETCKDFCNCNCDDLAGRVYLQRYGRDCYAEENTKANNKAVNNAMIYELENAWEDRVSSYKKY